MAENVKPRPVVWSHAETLAALERFKRRYPGLYQRVRGKKAVDHAGR